MGSEGQSISTFIEDVRAALKVHKLRDVEVAEFILAQLEGAARQEMKHQPPDVTGNPEKILEKLVDNFGGRWSLGSMMRKV